MRFVTVQSEGQRSSQGQAGLFYHELDHVYARCGMNVHWKPMAPLTEAREGRRFLLHTWVHLHV